MKAKKGLPGTPERLNRRYIDTETTGLMGMLNLVQVGKVDDTEFIRPMKNRKRMNKLLEELNDPNNLFILYNSPFDLWHLYKFYRPKKPFVAKFLDLYNLVLTSSPLSPFIGKEKKSVCRLNGIHKSVSEKIANRMIVEIGKRVNLHGVEVTCSFHKSKSGKDFNDLSFHLSVTGKLKDVVVALGLVPQAQKIEETGWVTLEDEKEYLPGIEQGRESEYIRAYIQNEKILDDENSSMWWYARDDIHYLRLLDAYFGCPLPSMDDKINDILVYTRYVGFTIDLEGLEEYIVKLEKELQGINQSFAFDLASSKQRLEYLNNTLGLQLESSKSKELEKARTNLQSVAFSNAFEGSDEILASQAKQTIQRLDLLIKYGAIEQRKKQAKKIVEAGGAYPKLKGVGAASGRMTGEGGLNYQGIERGKDGIRKYILASQVGDFDSLELNLAAYLYDDKQLQDDLLHKDLHLLSGMILLPDMTYDEAKIILDDTNSKEYKRVKFARSVGKSLNFSKQYNCTPVRWEAILIENKVINPIETANKAFSDYEARYTGTKEWMSVLEKKICTLDPLSWETAREDVSRMESKITSVLGFTRHFDFEKSMCELLINTQIENEVIEEDGDGEKIVRSAKKGKQTIRNSVLSARLGAILMIQAKVFKQAANHYIQSVGAQLTKELMIAIWDKFGVPMMNIHDEIVIPAQYGKLYQEISVTVQEYINSRHDLIPTLSMGWDKVSRWSEKK